MSTGAISGGGSPLSTAPLPLDPAAVAAAASDPVPTVLPPVGSYLSLGFASNTFAMLGIDLPRTPNDVATLLAQASALLDETVTEGRNHREAAIGEKMRSAFSGLAAVIGTMTTLHNEFVGLEGQRDTKKQERDGAVANRDAKQQTSASLQGQIDGKNSQIATLNSQIAAATNADVKAQLTSQRDALVVQRDALISQKAAVDQEIVQLNNKIGTLNGQIATIEADMAVKSQQYFDTQASMFNVFALSALFLADLTPVNVLRDFERDLGLSQLVDDIANRLRGGSLSGFGPLSFLDQIRMEAVVQRLALLTGVDFHRDQMADLLAVLPIGDSNQTTLLGLVLEAAIMNVSLDLLRDVDARDRVLTAGLGLVAGLADVITTLSALDALAALDPYESLSDGLRLRLAI